MYTSMPVFFSLIYGTKFIAQRMQESDVWRNASEAEFDNAMEGMEKLVMNRLYEL